MQTDRKKTWETPEISRLSVKSLTLTKAASDTIEEPGKDGVGKGKGHPSS